MTDLVVVPLPGVHHARPTTRDQGDTAVTTPDVIEHLKAELDDQRAARRTAAEAADRFRDVLSEALGYPDENPGDDVLVAKLREHFGRSGPEPTRWRDALVGYKAAIDQINAARPTTTEETRP